MKSTALASEIWPTWLPGFLFKKKKHPQSKLPAESKQLFRLHEITEIKEGNGVRDGINYLYSVRFAGSNMCEYTLQVDEALLLQKGKEVKTATFKLGPVKLYVVLRHDYNGYLEGGLHAHCSGHHCIEERFVLVSTKPQEDIFSRLAQRLAVRRSSIPFWHILGQSKNKKLTCQQIKQPSLGFLSDGKLTVRVWAKLLDYAQFSLEEDDNSVNIMWTFYKLDRLPHVPLFSPFFKACGRMLECALYPNNQSGDGHTAAVAVSQECSDHPLSRVVIRSSVPNHKFEERTVDKELTAELCTDDLVVLDNIVDSRAFVDEKLGFLLDGIIMLEIKITFLDKASPQSEGPSEMRNLNSEHNHSEHNRLQQVREEEDSGLCLFCETLPGSRGLIHECVSAEGSNSGCQSVCDDCEQKFAAQGNALCPKCGTRILGIN